MAPRSLVLPAVVVLLLAIVEATHLGMPCVCNKREETVCASNGKSYGNPCTLECDALSYPSENIQAVTVWGYCPPRVRIIAPLKSECLKKCRPLTRMICGSDGVTYSNICVFNCIRHSYGDYAELTVANEGHCGRNQV